MTTPRQSAPKQPAPADPQATERELTVLDWFRSLLRLKPIPIPASEAAEGPPLPRPRRVPAAETPPAQAGLGLRLQASQLRLPVALFLALLAQAALAARGENIWLAIVLYLLAAGIAGWALWARDFNLAMPAEEATGSMSIRIRRRLLAIGLVLALLTYLASADNTFRTSTAYLWAASTALTVLALWEYRIPWGEWRQRFAAWMASPRLSISMGPWSLLLLGALALSAYFRFASLGDVPPEPWSDQAEKILDIVDVLNGSTAIFFPRNGGREAAQFYLAAAAVAWFGAPLNYLTLKTITALAGLLSLPFIYMFGRELWGRGPALAGMVLAGVAFWPNVISRVGLRMPFQLLFLAPALGFLVRGLRQGRRNDLLLAGLATGLSFYGYSAGRINPLVVLVGFLIYLAHPAARGRRRTLLLWFAMLVGVAVVVSVPFLRTVHDAPQDVFYRTVTRMGETERPLEGPPLAIFASNMWKALLMFAWDGGATHVYSIPFKPILDWISGALFHLGLVLVVIGYLRRRRWEDLFTLLAIPLLLLPSVLALAFPIENPHPGRAIGASVPVFLIAALPLAALTSQLEQAWGSRKLGIGISALIVLVIAGVNYKLTIPDYGERMRDSSWNVTEAGAVVMGFIDSVGSLDHAYVTAYPHWMDPRLVADIAGHPGEDLTLWEDQLAELTPIDEPQLFLVHPEDKSNLELLEAKFPDGDLSRYLSRVEGRDFLIYYVPPAAEAALEAAPILSETDD